MRLLHLVPIIGLLLALHYPLSTHIWEHRYQMQGEIPSGYVLPSRYSRVLSLGNRGLLADFLFLKTVSFVGGRIVSGQGLHRDDWNYLVTSLEVITDLDPYFRDPYFLAEGLLAWDAGMPEKANEILLKGYVHRPNDWQLPFFVGFNYFYFLKDYAAAADYMMAAARLPDSPSYLKTLAGRLAYFGGKSKPALLFLQEMVEEANDPILRNRLAKRLLALERAVMIEEAAENFTRREGRPPDTIGEIVSRGYLTSLPDDPYGGTWGILTNGRVYSTSRFADAPPVSVDKPHRNNEP